MSYWEDELDDIMDEAVNQGRDVDYPRNENRRFGDERRVTKPDVSGTGVLKVYWHYHYGWQNDNRKKRKDRRKS